MAGPLSTAHNWHDELARYAVGSRRFAPQLPTMLYHGTKPARMKLRKQMQGANAPAVVVTSYEMILQDRAFLARRAWKYIVVDEGHRLKNLNCRLIRELKQFRTHNRLILTGTPLHNNLAELWSLLNFILPDIFDDLSTFEQWFDLGGADDDAPAASVTTSFAAWSTGTARRVVQQLHEILKPFLLRRVKADVEQDLPPKQEYLLYTPLSALQMRMYNAALHGELRDWLVASHAGLPLERVRALQDAQRRVAASRHDARDAGTADEQARMAAAEKQVRALRIDNLLMQLRKICSHPYLLDWPVEPGSDRLRTGPAMTRASGKLRMLSQLTSALLRRGHRVLVFSQFAVMLDLLEVWASDVMHWPTFRIDGSTPQEERASQVRAFNRREQNVDLFLLSTRASGLGINLVGADTVIFYDSDWNPQMDLQAQDRVHRIGQTKPVLIFRLVAAHTMEHDLVQRARAKRLLEAVVIRKGKFQRPIRYAPDDDAADDDKDTPAWVPEQVQLEAHHTDDDTPLLSDEQLDALLDRSADAYTRTAGWVFSHTPAAGGPASALFEVTETQPDTSAAQLTQLLHDAEAPASPAAPLD